jgi:hypothetical protein
MIAHYSCMAAFIRGIYSSVDDVASQGSKENHGMFICTQANANRYCICQWTFGPPPKLCTVCPHLATQPLNQIKRYRRSWPTLCPSRHLQMAFQNVNNLDASRAHISHAGRDQFNIYNAPAGTPYHVHSQSNEK